MLILRLPCDRAVELLWVPCVKSGICVGIAQTSYTVNIFNLYLPKNASYIIRKGNVTIINEEYDMRKNIASIYI